MIQVSAILEQFVRGNEKAGCEECCISSFLLLLIAWQGTIAGPVAKNYESVFDQQP